MPEDPKDWNEWSHYVLKTQERQEEMHTDLLKEFQTFRVDITKEIATLKAQAGMWGAGAGLVVGAIVSGLIGLMLS